MERPIQIAELRNSIVALARRLRQSARAESESWTGLMALAVIQRADGLATPTQIADELDLRSSNLAQILSELDTRGLIRRKPDDSDKRKVRLSLTEAGIALVDGTRAKRDHWLAGAIAVSLTPEEQAHLMAAGALMQRVAMSSYSVDD